MSIYNTGAVTVKVGSSEIIGSGTNFASNVIAGYFFRLTSASSWYEVATINTATKLQLSARYADSTYQTSRVSESLASLLATPVTATKVYSGILDYYPVIQSSVTINASIERFTDDSGGILTGDGTPAGSGTIDYDTGAWTIITGTVVTGTTNMAATYSSGNTLTAMPYQIVTDYTTHYGFPEMGGGDTNIHYVYTKSMRLIDSTLNDISASTGLNAASINTLQTYITSTYVKVGAIYLFSGTVETDSSASIVAAAQSIITPVPKGSVFYNASPADIWSFTATMTATKV